MRATVAAIILLCSGACQQTAKTDLHNVIKEQQAQIAELEVELEDARRCTPLQACEASLHVCDMLRMQVEHITMEVRQWKEIAENCVNKKLEVKTK